MSPPVQSNSTVSRTLDLTLQKQFNKPSFRPHQREIIQAALEKKDVFVQAATSFGKSLCYQLPAVLDRGITIVVSPLLSLMINQVEALRAVSINASSLNSNTPLVERNAIYKDLQTGHPRIRLLYVTPELCAMDRFRDQMRIIYKQNELARIAIDEAHCISEWGHDFRRDFKKLSWFRQAFPEVPIMCLTATANERVRADVLTTLGLKDSDRLQRFVMSAHRPNLHLEIRFTNDSNDERLGSFMKWIRGVYARRSSEPRRSELGNERVGCVPGIIYTISRDECDRLASQLRDEGIGAQPFHAQLSKEAKEQTLQRWISDVPGYEVVVATTAFGMGIDKENVRFVCHWRLPKSFEGYYQEAGRAGRDGNASYCFLYYSREDRDRVSYMLLRERQSGATSSMEGWQSRVRSLQTLAEYCESTNECRHRAICRYFGENQTPFCDYACDWHKDSADLQKRFLRGLASEEFVSTQREEGRYEVYWED